jgi:hypothetical protein
MGGLLQYLVDHWGYILPWVYMGTTALFVTMPPKGTKFDGEAVYGWFFDAVHQFANLSPQRPTLPPESASAAQPKQK